MRLWVRMRTGRDRSLDWSVARLILILYLVKHINE